MNGKMVLAALTAGGLALSMPRAHAARFVVLDQKASNELSETTRLYIDGSLIATVRLDQATPEGRIPVLAPDRPGPTGQTHRYALCGQVSFRNDDGQAETHSVDSQGVLLNPGGRLFLAIGTRSFTDFYLADPTDPSAATRNPDRPSVCETPIS